MRLPDEQLRIELQHDIAEVGGRFVGHLQRSPADGASNDREIGRVRGVRVSLKMTTEGRGDTDSMEVAEVAAAVDEYGMASQQFELEVPLDVPVSYDGRLIRVRWQIEARTDRKLAVDAIAASEVLVVPRGGLGHYDRPHPLG